MKKITDLAHQLLLPYLHKHAVCADFTMGNGFDTQFLASHVHHVYAFDIQEDALIHTKKRCGSVGLNNIQYILDSHENAKDYIHELLDVAVFNLGYLPNGDESCTTLLSSTEKAIMIAHTLLKQKGALLICVYPGHEEGKKESEWIDSFFTTCEDPYYKVITGVKNAPYFYLLEKRHAIQLKKNMVE